MKIQRYVDESLATPSDDVVDTIGRESVFKETVQGSIFIEGLFDFLPNTELCAGYENGGKDFCAVSAVKLYLMSSY